MLPEKCPNCLAYHGIPPLAHLTPGVPCKHNPDRECDICGGPVGGLSMGGSRICAQCDMHGWPGHLPPLHKKNPLDRIVDALNAEDTC